MREEEEEEEEGSEEDDEGRGVEGEAERRGESKKGGAVQLIRVKSGAWKDTCCNLSSVLL